MSQERELSHVTRRIYSERLAKFVGWFEEQGLNPDDPDPLALARYFREVPHSRADLSQHCGAIRRFYVNRGVLLVPTDHLAVRKAISEAKQKLPPSRPRKMLPIHPPMLSQLVAKCGPDPKGLRDRAMFLSAFALELNLTAVSALLVEHLDKRNRSIRFKGHSYAMPGTSVRDPWNPILEWLKAAFIVNGPIFQSVNRAGEPSGQSISGEGIRHLLNDYCARIGRDPRLFGPNSFVLGARAARKSGADTTH